MEQKRNIGGTQRQHNLSDIPTQPDAKIPLVVLAQITNEMSLDEFYQMEDRY